MSEPTREVAEALWQAVWRALLGRSRPHERCLNCQAAVAAIEAALAAQYQAGVAAAVTQVDGMELTQPTPYGPLYDVGWTAAIRTLASRLRGEPPAPEET